MKQRSKRFKFNCYDLGFSFQGRLFPFKALKKKIIGNSLEAASGLCSFPMQIHIQLKAKAGGTACWFPPCRGRAARLCWRHWGSCLGTQHARCCLPGSCEWTRKSLFPEQWRCSQKQQWWSVRNQRWAAGNSSPWTSPNSTGAPVPAERASSFLVAVPSIFPLFPLSFCLSKGQEEIKVFLQTFPVPPSLFLPQDSWNSSVFHS